MSMITGIPPGGNREVQSTVPDGGVVKGDLTCVLAGLRKR